MARIISATKQIMIALECNQKNEINTHASILTQIGDQWNKQRNEEKTLSSCRFLIINIMGRGNKTITVRTMTVIPG